MSSGPFTSTFYETDAGDILGARLQPETLAAVLGGSPNAAPSGPANDKGRVIVSSRRRNGVNARYVTLRWTGAPPAGYSGLTARVCVPDPAVFNALNDNDDCTYLGTACTLRGKTAEKIV